MKSRLPNDLCVQPSPRDIREAWERAAGRLGPFAEGLCCFSTVTSTNDLAMRLADAGAREGTALVAEEQTAGRGRRGHEWFSPPGSGIYVSVILRPRSADGAQGPNSITSRMTMAAGVALAEGVRASTGLPAELKWPNDLIIDRRKLAGILAEMATGPQVGTSASSAPAVGVPTAAAALEAPAVVVGIGINIRTTAYPAELAATATSLETELGRPVDRALVLVETLAALAWRYEDLQTGRFDAILTAWRACARSLPGSPIEWDSAAGLMRGQAVDIDHDGALLAQTPDGIVRLVAGAVRWR